MSQSEDQNHNIILSFIGTEHADIYSAKAPLPYANCLGVIPETPLGSNYFDTPSLPSNVTAVC